jgi:hypothetical protein
MAEENADCGAPKIHGELRKLCFVDSERTVARYLRRVRRHGDPAKPWLAGRQNHRDVIAALDFFTVPAVTFQLLYGLFVIEPGHRKILHALADSVLATDKGPRRQERYATPELKRLTMTDRERVLKGFT